MHEWQGQFGMPLVLLGWHVKIVPGHAMQHIMARYMSTATACKAYIIQHTRGSSLRGRAADKAGLLDSEGYATAWNLKQKQYSQHLLVWPAAWERPISGNAED